MQVSGYIVLGLCQQNNDSLEEFIVCILLMYEGSCTCLPILTHSEKSGNIPGLRLDGLILSTSVLQNLSSAQLLRCLGKGM
jgi:hypothetical protein